MEQDNCSSAYHYQNYQEQNYQNYYTDQLDIINKKSSNNVDNQIQYNQDDLMDQYQYGQYMDNIQNQNQYQVVSLSSLFDSVKRLLQTTKQTTGLNYGWGLLLLKQLNWQVDRFDIYFDNMKKYKEQIKFSQSLLNVQSSFQTNRGQCQMCANQTDDLIKNICGHQFCRQCWAYNLQTHLKQKNPFTTCMQVNCKIPLLYQTVLNILSNQTQIFYQKIINRYYKTICQFFTATNNSYRFCSGADCNYIIKSQVHSVTTVRCKCGKLFCFKCNNDDHQPCLCQQRKLWIDVVMKQQANAKWIAQNTKICPNCKKAVQKSAGCNFMACRCGSSFCYVCSRPWQPDHKDHFKCSVYVKRPDQQITVCLCILLSLTICSDILVVLDNAQLKNTHTQFFNMLQSNNIVQYAYTFGNTKIQLKNYDRFKYQHVIVMGLSVKYIVSYFDQGNNIMIIGDIDTDKTMRKLYHSFGGCTVRDYFSNYNQNPSMIQTMNYISEPFFSNYQLPLLFQGPSMKMVNYQNYQLYPLITSQSTTFSHNYITSQTTTLGPLTLAVAIQGLNNARAVILNSLLFFSDLAFKQKQFNNLKATQSILSWVFNQQGIIRATNLKYKGQGSNQQKQTVFNVGQKILFNVQVQTKRGNQWIPFNSQQLQVQFVMIDPWVRVPLKQIGQTKKYQSQFYAPGKQGIYQFKIIFKKPGYSFLSIAQRVTVRPYKHDQYERFLFVASPYQLSLVLTIVSTFVFIIVYLYSDFKKIHVKQQ